MAEQIVATCKTTTILPDDSYRFEYDIFRNAALVSTNTLDELGTDHYEYIEVKSANGSEGWSEAVYVQAVPLAVGFEHQDSKSDEDIINMRTNVMK